jgi:hypothetical protein
VPSSRSWKPTRAFRSNIQEVAVIAAICTAENPYFDKHGLRSIFEHVLTLRTLSAKGNAPTVKISQSEMMA